MGWHVTNLPACTLLTSQTSCSFQKRTRSLKKRTGRFHWKNKSFLKFDLLFFPITVSTCRNALFLLQIFQPFRKRPARRHSGWRICIVKCFSRKISFRKTIPQKSEEYQLGWNIPTPAEGFLNPILQPECPRVGRLRAGWSFWRIFQGIPYRAWRMTIFHWKK